MSKLSALFSPASVEAYFKKVALAAAAGFLAVFIPGISGVVVAAETGASINFSAGEVALVSLLGAAIVGALRYVEEVLTGQPTPTPVKAKW